LKNIKKARINFVQTIADLASKSQNIEALNAAGVMALLKPLLLDTVPSIQQSAALAIGRLANFSEELSNKTGFLMGIPGTYSISKKYPRLMKIESELQSESELETPRNNLTQEQLPNDSKKRI